MKEHTWLHSSKSMTIAFVAMVVVLIGVKYAEAQFISPSCVPPNCNPQVIQNIPLTDSAQTADFNITGDGGIGNELQVGTGAPVLSAGTDNLIYGNVGGGSTAGSLMLLQKGGVDRFRVDLSGNAMPSGNFRAPAGASSSPSYSFSGDTDTGLYNAGTNTVMVVAGGANSMQFSAGGVTTGSVGSAVAPAYTMGGDTNTGFFGGTDIIGFTVGGTEAFRVNGDGSVTFNGNVNLGSGVLSGDGSQITNINANNITTGTVSSARLPATVAYTDAANVFTPTQQFSGDVGIGIAPTAPFHFNSTSATGGNNGMQICNGACSHVFWGVTKDWYIRPGDTSSGRVIIADTGGNVGVGTSSPASALHIEAGGQVPGSNAGQFRIVGTGTQKKLLFGVDTLDNLSFIQSIETGAGFMPLILNVLGGNIGVGTAAPSQKLDVSGSLNVTVTGIFGTDVTVAGSSVCRADGTNCPPGAVSSVSGSGAGISVSPTIGAVVVQNTGVTSAVAGVGIGLSGGTGAVTITNTGDTNAADDITGSGTTNYVSKFTGTRTIGNSSIYDSGTKVGIGTTTPLAKLDVVDYSTGSTGISGRGRGIGVYGTGLATPGSTGVYGNGNAIGVHGQSAIGGTAVKGDGDIGVWGASTTGNYGGYFSSTGYAVFAAGDIRSTGDGSIVGSLTVGGTGAFTGNLTVAGSSVCRADGTNCPPGAVASVSGSGAGISVSPTTGAVVVQNTGVTSAVAGVGIGLSGGTGAVTITNTGDLSNSNEMQNLFSTMNAPGGTDPVSDTTTDTLNFANGAGISITGNATTDTLTITNTGDTNAADDITSLASGSGISVTGSGNSRTITNTGDLSNSNELQSLFRTMNAPGGTDPVSDTTTDTLNFANGAGISISGNASTDTLTFTNTGDTNPADDITSLASGSGISVTGSGNSRTITNTGDTNAADDITGSGSANYIPKFTGTRSLGNSALYQSGSNIGIGTTTPNFKLSLGSTTATTKLALYETGTTNAYGLGVVSGAMTLHLNGSSSRFAFLNNETSGSEVFTITGGGAVGIGNTAPSYNLDVSGTGRITGALGAGGVTPVGGYGMRAQGSTMGGAFYDTSGQYSYVAYGNWGLYTPYQGYFGGNVGIGTSAPSAKLHVVGGFEWTKIGTYYAIESYASGNYHAAGKFDVNGDGSASVYLALDNGSSDYGLYTTDNAGYTYGVRATGTYGIYGRGSTAGGYFYDTNNTAATYLAYANYSLYSTMGDARIGCSSTTWTDYGSYIGCNDIAEVYEAGEALEPGDVVVWHADTNKKLYRSENAYDELIAGVYSTSPGVMLGNQDEEGNYGVTIGNSTTQESIRNMDGNHVPLALSGRVPVKVTGEGGRIKPGDVLTSSSTPGYAMKATKSGRVIGMAMEAFDGDSGKIMAFINPHYWVNMEDYSTDEDITERLMNDLRELGIFKLDRRIEKLEDRVDELEKALIELKKP